jgi:DNA modification methylase
MNSQTILIGDCAETLKTIPDESVDLIVTDPPYGYEFMGLDWDKALPSLDALKECFRVLKHGSFGFFMCAPRQDVMGEMISQLRKAGFETAFSSIFWIYTTGMPKSANTIKLLAQRYGDKVILTSEIINEQFTKFDGSYLGLQLKPAAEPILVVMRPIAEKTYLDQALKNNHGISWLKDCKIPWAIDDSKICEDEEDSTGRFPANVLCCDDALNDGRINKGTNETMARIAGAGALGQNKGWNAHNNKPTIHITCNDTGSYSRFFDLDAWFRNKLPTGIQDAYPALIVPKPTIEEKNKYAENNHPTVKPIKLMAYLITMGSRTGEVILDPYVGSGTTLEAANLLDRKFIGCELDPKYKNLIEARAYMRSFTKSNKSMIQSVVSDWISDEDVIQPDEDTSNWFNDI